MPPRPTATRPMSCKLVPAGLLRRLHLGNQSIQYGFRMMNSAALKQGGPSVGAARGAMSPGAMRGMGPAMGGAHLGGPTAMPGALSSWVEEDCICDSEILRVLGFGGF